CDLFLEVDLAKVKLVRQALFVSGLQEPWTESSMDLDRCADDVFGDLLVMKHSVSPNVGCTEVYHPSRQDELTTEARKRHERSRRRGANHGGTEGRRSGENGEDELTTEARRRGEEGGGETRDER